MFERVPYCTRHSRAQKEGLTEYQQSVGRVVRENRSNNDGFPLAIFTFKTSDSKERYRAREILGYYGFKMIAQNVYIRRRITGRHLEETIETEGPQDNIFVFDCSDPGTEALKTKLYAQFDVPNATRKLHEFKDDLMSFLDPNVDPMELARRIFYAGPVQHKICFEDEPPLPESYYPEDYPMEDIIGFYEEIIERHMNDLVGYYVAIEGPAWTSWVSITGNQSLRYQSLWRKT